LVPAAERLPIAGEVTESGKPVLRLCREDAKSTVVGCVPCELTDGGVFHAVQLPNVADNHAKLTFVDGALFITDLGSKTGTWITSIAGGRHKLTPKMPTRVRPEDIIEFGPSKEAQFKVKLRRLQEDSSDS